MKKSNLTLSIGILTLLSACSYQHPKDNSSAAQTGAVSYNDVRTQVFAVSCFSCHSNSGGNDGGVNLETYDFAKTQVSLIERDVFERKSMPKNGTLTDAQRATLKAWLDEGAPEEAPSAPSTDDEPAPTIEGLSVTDAYEKVIKPEVFMKSCMPCHSTEKAYSKVILDTFAGAKEATGDLRHAVLGILTMPPRNVPFTNEQSKLLKNWLDEMDVLYPPKPKPGHSPKPSPSDTPSPSPSPAPSSGGEAFL